MPRWIRYQVRQNCTDGTKKFTPHYAVDRDTGVQNYDPKNLESVKQYAHSLGAGAYVVRITEEVIAQY